MSDDPGKWAPAAMGPGASSSESEDFLYSAHGELVACVVATWPADGLAVYRLIDNGPAGAAPWIDMVVRRELRGVNLCRFMFGSNPFWFHSTNLSKCGKFIGEVAWVLLALGACGEVELPGLLRTVPPMEGVLALTRQELDEDDVMRLLGRPNLLVRPGEEFVQWFWGREFWERESAGVPS